LFVHFFELINITNFNFSIWWSCVSLTLSDYVLLSAFFLRNDIFAFITNCHLLPTNYHQQPSFYSLICLTKSNLKLFNPNLILTNDNMFFSFSLLSTSHQFTFYRSAKPIDDYFNRFFGQHLLIILKLELTFVN